MYFGFFFVFIRLNCQFFFCLVFIIIFCSEGKGSVVRDYFKFLVFDGSYVGDVGYRDKAFRVGILGKRGVLGVGVGFLEVQFFFEFLVLVEMKVVVLFFRGGQGQFLC